MKTIKKVETESNASGDRSVKTVAGEIYWTSSKAAHYLGVSKVCLLNYAKQKRVTKLNFGGFVLYKQEWLDEFINESTSIGVATRRQK